MGRRGSPFPRVADRFALQVEDVEAAAGRDLHLYQRVRILAADVDRLVTGVRAADERELEVRLCWEKVGDGVVEATCPCTAAHRRRLCRHIWATILHFEQYDGRIPGDGALNVEILEEEIPWPEKTRYTTLQSGLESYFYHREGEDHEEDDEPRLPWRQELTGIEQQIRPRLRRMEVYYRLDLWDSWDGQLFISLHQRAVRKSGKLGNFKMLKLSEAEVRELPDPADREILPLLLATASTEKIDQRYAFAADKPRRFDSGIVPSIAFRTTLPLLCSTGRFHWSRGNYYNHDLVELAWDEEPWRFVLGVEPHERFGEGRMHGILERTTAEGTERRPLSAADLVMTNGLVLLDGTFSPLHTGDAGAWIRRLATEGDILLPLDELPALVDQLRALPSLPPLDLPRELHLEQVSVTPERGLTCRVRRPAGEEESRAASAAIHLEVFFVYDGVRVAASEPPSGLIDRAGRRMLVRDLHFEQQALAELVELGPVRPVTNVDGSYRLLPQAFSALVTALLERGWLVEAEGGRVRSAGTASWSIRTKIDWFELHGDVDFEGVAVPVPVLLRALRRGERLVRLGDGSHGMLPDDWVERFTPLAQMTAVGDTSELRPSQAAMIDLLLEETGSRVDADAEFDKLRARLRSSGGARPRSEPEGFGGELRPYQRDGLGWLVFLRDLGFGGCLADDMGLGKTVQVLALLAIHHLPSPATSPASSPATATSLIVVPRSIVVNWVSEARRFTPGLRVLDVTALSAAQRGDVEGLKELLGRHHLAVTTYGLLRRDVINLREIDFTWVILDEAQAIKNARSQTARAARVLRAEHRLALTGTPVENHLGELGSLFEFLNPGMLGRALRRPATSGDDPALRRLVKALRPFLLRRTKEQVLTDLPAKTEQTIYCQLGGEGRREYDQLREHYRLRLDQRILAVGLGKSKLQVLEALLRLRQAACHPGLIDHDRGKESSAKLDVLFEHLEEILSEGHKALVFSQFVRLLAIVRRQLDERGITYEYLDGSTRDRAARVERFQTDPDCPLFLISLKAGGLGLNLTAADYVFILDPWWNPAVEAQAIDRTHRIGQTRPVFAYRLVTRDTVEEKILTLQDTKRKLADALLAGSAQGVRGLTAEDLEVLFS